MNALVVDGQTDVGVAVSGLLRHQGPQGLAVVRSTTVNEAVHELQTQRFDVIVCHCRKHDMTLETLRAAAGETPIVAYTDHATQVEIQTLYRAGAWLVLQGGIPTQTLADVAGTVALRTAALKPADHRRTRWSSSLASISGYLQTRVIEELANAG